MPTVFSPDPRIQVTAHVSSESQYQKLYQQSLVSPDDFWLEQANSLDWMNFPTKGLDYDWNLPQGQVWHQCYADGELNVASNCLDRHLDARGEQTAIIWQGNEDEDVRRMSYRELYTEVCRLSNVLKKHGVGKGDRVGIYLPMVPEAAVAMLACARIGAVHTVVFGGFSHEALRNRLQDCGCQLLITASYLRRGAKTVPLKQIADQALSQVPQVTKVLVVQVIEQDTEMQVGRDLWYHSELSKSSEECPPERMNAEDPLFILYTSGSTGKPKGLVHTQAGYLLYASLTHKLTFDLQPDDVYWCTADVGWITGHSYIIYGPLANGATTLMFEGIPTYPDAGRFWQICEKFGVTKFYTSPTAVRSLMKAGDEWPAKYDLSSLRILGTVGEPINPEAWLWYYQNIGQNKCPIVDTWWQTETGGHLITSLPGAHPLKPGSAGRPFFGVEPVILDDQGELLEPNAEGKLCLARPWPGMARTMWGDHNRFIETYFSQYPGYYFSGDGAVRDRSGDFWLKGRVDDVISVSGHRLGTAEIESTLSEHYAVAESAVVSVPHDVKGQGIVAYVVLKNRIETFEELPDQLTQHIRQNLSPIATPEKVVLTPELPKTRSGKIMRRILRKLAEGDYENLGDISTLANPEIVDRLKG
jgi:acetyl-CoA synthetase